jgi:hypothetical protein
VKTIKLSSIEINPDNPRIIRDKPYKSLLASIKRDPEFLEKRGIVHADGVILGGNQRYLAVKEALTDDVFRNSLGLNRGEIPATWVQDASGWPAEKRRRFIIVDNGPAGEWNYDILSSLFDDLPLIDLGVDIPKHWANITKEKEDGKDGEVEKPNIIECPNCKHQFSVLKEKK